MLPSRAARNNSLAGRSALHRHNANGGVGERKKKGILTGLSFIAPPVQDRWWQGKSFKSFFLKPRAQSLQSFTSPGTAAVRPSTLLANYRRRFRPCRFGWIRQRWRYAAQQRSWAIAELDHRRPVALDQ